jgi:hypothetical protein
MTWATLKMTCPTIFYCCMYIRYHSNVSTEPLHSNNRGIFTEPLPSNDKKIFTMPLPSNDRGDTHKHTDNNVIS